MGANCTYNKTEKLKSRTLLNNLFTGGQQLSVFPVKVFFTLHEQAATAPVQAGVGVSARNFKKAVHRNRIKRLLRECYRLNKAPLHAKLNATQRSVSVFFLYVGKELPEYASLTEKMQACLTKLEERIG